MVVLLEEAVSVEEVQADDSDRYLFTNPDGIIILTYKTQQNEEKDMDGQHHGTIFYVAAEQLHI